MSMGDGTIPSSVAGMLIEALRSGQIAEKAIGKDGKIDWNHVDTKIERHGSKIILPNDPSAMPIPKAIDALKRLMADEESEMGVRETIDAYPLDGAVAFMMALKHKYGWASPIPTPGFFGPCPPQMATVEIGPNPEDKIQVPWGSFQVPNIEKPLVTSVENGEFGLVFAISGTLRKREIHVLKDIAELTQRIVRERSIYRGKAIRIRTDDDGDMNVNVPPSFIATDHIKPTELIFPESVQSLVETNIYTLIRRTQICRDNGIPLKRGVLLEGQFGVGKTMCATVTAKYCVENGWTFITLDRATGLRQALEFAKRYAPAVVFAEDIDRSTEERDDNANDLSLVLDGALSKNSEVMVVLTTNNVDKIHPVMLRPGRLDAVISVLPPDAKAVERLIRLYARSTLSPAVNLETIGKQLEGHIPAVIREVVERSKLAMIARGGDSLAEQDLIVSATGMKQHMALLNPPAPTELTPQARVGHDIAEIITKIVADSVAGTVTKIKEDTEALREDAGC